VRKLLHVILSVAKDLDALEIKILRYAQDDETIVQDNETIVQDNETIVQDNETIAQDNETIAQDDC
jgi:hypothetical protein